MVKLLEDQGNLSVATMNFKKKKQNHRIRKKKQERKVVLKNLHDFFEGRDISNKV